MNEMTLPLSAAGAPANKANECNGRKWYVVKQFMRSIAFSAYSSFNQRQRSATWNDERTTGKEKHETSYVTLILWKCFSR